MKNAGSLEIGGWDRGVKFNSENFHEKKKCQILKVGFFFRQNAMFFLFDKNIFCYFLGGRTIHQRVL